MKSDSMKGLEQQALELQEILEEACGNNERIIVAPAKVVVLKHIVGYAVEKLREDCAGKAL